MSHIRLRSALAYSYASSARALLSIKDCTCIARREYVSLASLYSRVAESKRSFAQLDFQRALFYRYSYSFFIVRSHAAFYTSFWACTLLLISFISSEALTSGFGYVYCLGQFYLSLTCFYVISEIFCLLVVAAFSTFWYSATQTFFIEFYSSL